MSGRIIRAAHLFAERSMPELRPVEDNEPILQFFQWEHLPLRLQEISIPYCEMARRIVSTYPRNPERTVTLRKLLEAKDAAVRCNLMEY